MVITFLKAKLQALFERSGGRRAQKSNPKRFVEAQQREAAYDSRLRGIRTVPLHRIVGSVGRYLDFDDHFRPKSHVPSERLLQIVDAMRKGRPLPPVRLYQIKDGYYVLDGNHRIAAANQLGHDEILADIVEFIPSANTLQNMRYRERAEFLDRSGLPQDIHLTELGQHEPLLEQIRAHQNFLSRQHPDITLAEAARDWYRTIYRPLCKIIDKANLLESFPGRTVADLYAYISYHQWQSGRRRRYGTEIDHLIAQDMEEFRTKMNATQGQSYPELHRGITAFILMNVQARKEYKIVDRLFELDEVREIHSVHGDVDILVKIVLTRDLLSSDAENISQFVHEKVRQLSGVVSTKTLIPGYSRSKEPVGGETRETEPKRS